MKNKGRRHKAAYNEEMSGFLTDVQKKIIKGRICPYCKRETEYVDSSVIYGKSYGMIYLCKPCDAYCGVHKGTNKALGRVANAELRHWKKEAHEHFDKLWKFKYWKRTAAYRELSNYLNIPSKYTHIGMFSVETCKKVVQWSIEKLKEPNKFYNER